ncbi:2,4-dienoyl-CoA reductase-like NADH-dependent reductase (Old Yellow Enzyme family) [Rhizobium leguminosarum]|uniref:2,4-dienoyl-CoA reductase-like NADH-dependent reductase (Old Yellow Enzyme family) n=2 Tax=Rhizobium TaxID=379 RepID=A0AAE2MP31_RHILE|nr:MULTISPECIES: hypothetical protein [Rhizobium]MBB4292640.1 2,4-dienoyl-CoA reductase-like NADH-dependent reductase (Old Yellow Enzyme family) [Rhizobium leguminosarum]MBB4298878.1 2,4-dienoyl-CoA reductase-like NADH-dependent reductase (Old Yellow Enzyme family) [Rhizobium leguminosarum]MBB4310149.1 2,4-dienoyl-CoA reductase-like NADH-dependent reductase (Old Yellow Enzyme family) [Rhizobium leguminosarum]MBB4434411.1 2,4-dienoyl-CoA reductase-like NADH-dependent reductase (Old Yellow Enzyme
MSKLFPLLFSVRLRGHTLRNRIVFGAHTANMVSDGVPGDQHVAYYAERAIGGAGSAAISCSPECSLAEPRSSISSAGTSAS